MREKLRLVTSFDELRAGDLTVVKDCNACGAARCRGVLVRLVGEDWTCLPSCLPANNSTISRDCVDGGVVYLVDTGLEASDSTKATTRKPKSVRA